MIKQKLPENEFIDIINAEYVPTYKIHLYFNNGAEQFVDFETFLSKSYHPEIKKYLNTELFKTFCIKHGRLDWNEFDLCFSIKDLYEGAIR